MLRSIDIEEEYNSTPEANKSSADMNTVYMTIVTLHFLFSVREIGNIYTVWPTLYNIDPVETIEFLPIFSVPVIKSLPQIIHFIHANVLLFEQLS